MGERFDGMESGIESVMAACGLDVLNASVPSRMLIRITVRGTIVNPEKQPLPVSSKGAARVVVWYVFVVRARGMGKVSFLGHKDPGSKRGYKIVSVQLGVVASFVVFRIAGFIRNGMIRRLGRDEGSLL